MFQNMVFKRNTFEEAVYATKPSTQTGDGLIKATRNGNVVTITIDGGFDLSVADPDGSTMYTLLGTLPEKYAPYLRFYRDSYCTYKREGTRFYFADINGILQIKSLISSTMKNAYLYDVITYIGVNV